MGKHETTREFPREYLEIDLEERAIEAIRRFPLPSLCDTSENNYRRILEWLHAGPDSVASLVVELGRISR